MEDEPAAGSRDPRCPACGALNRPLARFCDACGIRLSARARRSGDRRRGDGRRGDGRRGEPLGDRRIVTALFADIVDYSRLIAELDAEEVVARVDEALRILAAAVDRYDGTVEKFIGDAVFAVFGARRAHDDDSLRAALCAMEMTAGLETVAHRHGEAPLRLRVGIATGEVVTSVRSIGDASGLAITGAAVTTAMRLQELAQPGDILLDDATVSAARDRLAVDPIGERLIRGRATPLRVQRLRGERPGRPVVAVGVGALVGRVVDRARLRSTLDRVLRTGRGGVLLIEGEAGIGKSRLVADLAADAVALGFAWTWTENLSYTTGEHYGHARLLAERLADEVGTDSGSLVRELVFTADVDPTVSRRFAGAIAAIARDARFSGWEEEEDLVPADPAQVRADLADATERYIGRLVETRGPRVLVIDDLHWMDPSSATLLGRLVRIVVDIPLVLILTTRPAITFEWTALGHVECIELRGLDRSGTERLAAAVAGTELDGDAVDRLHARTAGNPLFVGETVRSLSEDGALVMRDGRLHLAEPDRVDRVPVNLRAVLGARIDALRPAAREVLQLAAVVGMTFSARAVARLGQRRRVDHELHELAAAAIVSPGDGPDDWRFSHPLVHLVAYASILGVRRRDLHTRVADAMERQTPPPPIETLAHHRAAARDRERAVPLLAAAAEVALAVGATSEALGYWRTALGLLGDDPAAVPLRVRVAAVEAASLAAASGDPSGAPSR
ncbi:MAG: AAA family ATPase [Candidatus Limnocylindrales bacterium]